MNDSHLSEKAPAANRPEDVNTALFAQLVMQQSSMAMMLLGKTPHPASGQPVRDLEGAQLFIDQLEMLEVKTKGNLTPEETAILKQSLMSLRLAFVECVDAPPASAPDPASAATPPGEAAAAAKPDAPAPAPSSASGEEESRKKFTKKY